MQFKTIAVILSLATVSGIVYFTSKGAAAASTCGSNCPSKTCTSCPCGNKPLMLNIASECIKYSGWSQACCNCIASRESSGNANAMHQNPTGTLDVGLWQINQINWASCNGGAAPCSITANRNCAQKVWQWGGNTWRLWATASNCGCKGKKLYLRQVFFIYDITPEHIILLQQPLWF